MNLALNSAHCMPINSNVSAMMQGPQPLRSRLMLLAPEGAEIPRDFEAADCHPGRYEQLLASMQRLRGGIYLEDGAIRADQLTRDGRHCLTIDRESWHLLSADATGEVTGCVRYFSHPNTAQFEDLWVKKSAIAESPEWAESLRLAIEGGLRQARKRRVSFVEVGGWAIAPQRRCTTEALRTALSTYCLARLLGGCIGITTATVRHSSAAILRRIGGFSVQTSRGELPSYYDPQYDCEMEVLRFDSAQPTVRFAAMIGRMCAEVTRVPVVCRGPRPSIWSFAVSPRFKSDYDLQTA